MARNADMARGDEAEILGVEGPRGHVPNNSSTHFISTEVFLLPVSRAVLDRRCGAVLRYSRLRLLFSNISVPEAPSWRCGVAYANA